MASPSPGSILAVLAMTPKGGYLAVLSGVLISTVVSFLIASVFVKQASEKQDDSELAQAQGRMKDLKGNQVKKNVTQVIFACDAGMGSSAMGATTLRNKFKQAGLKIGVINCAIDALPANAQVVITHESLTARAKGIATQAEHISISNFLTSPKYDELVNRLR